MIRRRSDATGSADPGMHADAGPALVAIRNAARAGELVGALQGRGILAMQAATPRQAMVWARTVPPRLVVIDMEMPGATMLLHEFRSQGRQIVAVSDDRGRRSAALDAGCLEALHYSDAAEELAAHIASFVSRPGVQRVGRIACGPLEIDLSSRRAFMRGTELHLSPRQFDLAAYLAARPAQLTSSMALLQDQWGEVMDPRKVHLAAHRLRRQLDEPTDSTFFVSRRGFGYGFFPNVPDATRKTVNLSGQPSNALSRL